MKTMITLKRRFGAWFVSIAVGALAILPDGLRADPLDNWHVRNPFLAGNFGGVAYGNGRFWPPAVVSILQANGTTWSAANSYTSLGGNLLRQWDFFGTVGSGQLASSANGTNWSNLGWVANSTIRRVARGKNIYVAVTSLDFATTT